jgi:hypothetical protein
VRHLSCDIRWLLSVQLEKEENGICCWHVQCVEVADSSATTPSILASCRQPSDSYYMHQVWDISIVGPAVNAAPYPPPAPPRAGAPRPNLSGRYVNKVVEFRDQSYTGAEFRCLDSYPIALVNTCWGNSPDPIDEWTLVDAGSGNVYLKDTTSPTAR